MGWWAEKKRDRELLIGDGPVDAVISMMDSLVTDYQEDWHRRPLPEELARTIEIAISQRLHRVFDGLEGKEVSSVEIKFIRPKRSQKLRPGDYFAVPLASGGYGYGRIMAMYGRNIMLAAFLELQSKDLLDLEEIIPAPVLFETLSGNLALRRNEWPVVGSLPLLPLREGETEDEAFREQLSRFGLMHGSVTVRQRLEETLNLNRKRWLPKK